MIRRSRSKNVDNDNRSNDMVEDYEEKDDDNDIEQEEEGVAQDGGVMPRKRPQRRATAAGKSGARPHPPNYCELSSSEEDEEEAEEAKDDTDPKVNSKWRKAIARTTRSTSTLTSRPWLQRELNDGLLSPSSSSPPRHRRTSPRRANTAANNTTNQRIQQPLPFSARSERYPVGTRVYKLFPDHGWYWGTIRESIRDYQGLFYEVVYDDGDVEGITDDDDCQDLLQDLHRAVRAAQTMLTVQSKPLSSTTHCAGATGTAASHAVRPKDDDEEKKEESWDQKTKAKVKHAKQSQPNNKKQKTAAKKPALHASDSEFEGDGKDDDDEEEEEEDEEPFSDMELDSDDHHYVDQVDDDDEEDHFDPPTKKRKLVSSKNHRKNITTLSAPKKFKQTRLVANDDDDDDDDDDFGRGEEEIDLTDQAAKEEAYESVLHSISHNSQAASRRAANAAGSKQKAKGSAVGDQPFRTDVKAWKMRYEEGDNLPIIAEPQLMFDDMVGTQLTDNGKHAEILWPLLQTLHHRPLRVATMCSGTESPILALDMLQTAMRDVAAKHLADQLQQAKMEVQNLFQLEHVFSCEIEPFKQAYIERNFQPPILFRDIRELRNKQAATAYGGLVDVPCAPGCVDVLVAGTSCVDYSNLNTKRVRTYALEISKRLNCIQCFFLAGI